MPTRQGTRDEDLWRHAATHDPVSDCPLLDGNEITLLPSGADAIGAMFDALAQARDHIHLEYYIIDNVHFRGRCLLDLLLAARGRGVKIAIIYDSVGCLHTPDGFFQALAASGVQIIRSIPCASISPGI
jgi:cardiolipin synthase